MDWLALVYVKRLNVIHYNDDKYYYEARQLALKDTRLNVTLRTGISGLSQRVDSITRIKYGHVKAIVDENGVRTYFVRDNDDYPRYGNNDDRALNIRKWLVNSFYNNLNTHHLYVGRKLSTSVLTITSNVVYGNYTGTTPNGRH